MLSPIATTVTAGSQTSARSCTRETGKSSPLISTIRMPGERSLARCWIALPMPPRMTRSGAIPAVAAPSMIAVSVAASVTNASSGRRPAGAFGAASSGAARSAWFSGIGTAAVAVLITVFPVLGRQRPWTVDRAQRSLTWTAFSPRITWMPGSATTFCGGLTLAQSRRDVAGPDRRLRVGPPLRRDGGERAGRAQGQRQFAEFGRDIDLLRLFRGHLQRHGAAELVPRDHVRLRLLLVDRQHAQILDDSLGDRAARHALVLFSEFLRQDHVDLVAGNEQPGAGAAGRDRDRDRPVSFGQHDAQEVALAGLDDQIVRDRRARLDRGTQYGAVNCGAGLVVDQRLVAALRLGRAQDHAGHRRAGQTLPGHVLGAQQRARLQCGGGDQRLRSPRPASRPPSP